ncbi:MAG: ABC transporter ATP-binding protein [Planctomycetota bacterium]|nr:ABC transporter ATP-binding protein [Planctomycetota bacterium]
MQAIHTITHTPIAESFRVRQVQGMFDLPDQSEATTEFKVDIPAITDPWSIGLIVGPSGSGKTTVARAAFPQNFATKFRWPRHRSLLDAFPKNLGIVSLTQLLTSVGFSSPPAWPRPFHALSNGEQFRVNLARALAEMPDLVVIDEFTSVIDRTVAKIASAAVARAVRQRNQRFVAISCHYDVLPWLQPDWVLDMQDGALTQNAIATRENATEPAPETTANTAAVTTTEIARRLQRPPIALTIQRVHRSLWKLFHRHHYLTAKLHQAAACFLGLIENRPAVFVAALHFPHPKSPGWREHRCVCLPDFQGVGIGAALSEFVASLFAATGKPYTSVTSHPAIIHHRMRSPLWKMNRAPSRVSIQSQRRTIRNLSHLDNSHSNTRRTASFKYIGPPNPGLAKMFNIPRLMTAP